MNTVIEEFEHEVDGKTYTVEYHYDLDSGGPWENQDFYTENIETYDPQWYERGSKSPGEVLLTDYRNNVGVRYDFADAVRKVRESDVVPEEGETIGQLAERHVKREIQLIRDFLNDNWQYIGVVVRKAGTCRHCAETQSIWGVSHGCDQYDATDYIKNDLVPELVSDLNN